VLPPVAEPAAAAAVAAAAAPHPFVLPPLDEVAACCPPLVLAIPPQMLPAVGQALAGLFSALSGTDPAPWCRLALFCRCVLVRPPRRGRALAGELRRRLALWNAGHIAELWEAAQAEKRVVATAGTALPPNTTVSALGEPCTAPLPRDAEHLRSSSLDPSAVRRSLFWAREGALSRAVSALSAAVPAPENETTFAALEALHPVSPAFALPAVADTMTPEGVSLREVRSALHSFSRFSAGGLSLLTPRILLACASVPGSVLLEALRRPATLFVCGLVPAPVRPFFFGARLTALKKPKGGVRPVACGDVLRRLAAKVLCARDKPLLRALLEPHRQVGVAVPGGADVAATLARCVFPGAPCSLKMDFSNAFNSVHRGAILAACHDLLPVWFPHVSAAYGEPSWLYFGSQRLQSAGGVQQGDVLGPALFACVLRGVAASARAASPPLAAEVWFLDDGFVAGEPAAVAMFAERIEVEGARVGLALNRAKCEQFGCAAVPGVPLVPREAFVLLGVPCGPRADAVSWASSVAEAIAARCAAIAALPEAHVALVLLRQCGAFAMANFALRAVGPCVAWKQLDLAVRTAAEQILGPLGDAEWSIAQLPLSSGGLGLRPTAPFAALALAAASCASALRVRSWWPGVSADPALAFLALPSAVPASLHAPIGAALRVWTDALPDGAAAVVAPKYQRLWSGSLSVMLTETAVASLPPGQRAIVAAHAAPLASGWLAPCPAPEASPMAAAELWFSTAECLALCRRRLGLSACTPSPATPCPLCLRASACDDHLLSCMAGGLRKRLSDRVVDAVAAIISGGGSSVAKEPACFPSAPSRRADLLFRLGGSVPIAADVAISHVVLGTPDAYCVRKEAVYGPLAAAAGIRFVPVVFDTAGGVSSAAGELLRAAAARWGRRFDVHPGHAAHLALASLNRVLMRGVAGLLLRGLAAAA
jgi:hypothetical protein